jgi:hypothetical protein
MRNRGMKRGVRVGQDGEGYFGLLANAGGDVVGIAQLHSATRDLEEMRDGRDRRIARITTLPMITDLVTELAADQVLPNRGRAVHEPHDPLSASATTVRPMRKISVTG